MKGQKINEDMVVEDVLTQYPQVLPVFLKQGHCFGMLANKIARATLAKHVTIGQACKLHLINLENFLAELNDVLAGN